MRIKLNIWILNHYAISPKSVGGTRHYDLAAELVKKGHTVRIFASSFNHLTRKETIIYTSEFSKEEEVNGVLFTWIKTPPYHSSAKRLLNIGAFTYRVNRVINNILKQETPDLIIGSSVHPLTPLVGLRKARKANSLFYFEERDLWPQTFIDFKILGEKNIITTLLFKIESHLYKKADRTIFLFEKAHEYAFSKGLKKGKEILIPNGFSTQKLIESDDITVVKDMLAPLEGKKLCMYVGSMGEANHMIPLLELAKKMKDESEYHFLFVGKGPLKSSLFEYVTNFKLLNVTFHDPIVKEMIPDLLSYAECGLISMKDSALYNWGFSMNKVYDYLSIGLPIIMYSNLDDIGNLGKSNGVFNSNSLEDLKEYLIRTSEVDREAIKKFAHEHYSWNVLSELLLIEVEKDLVKVEGD